MILTCPECATSYFVDDLRVPRLGRMVRCSSCSHRWRAYQDRSEEEAAEDEEMIEGAAPPEPASSDDIEIVAASVTPASKLLPPSRTLPPGVVVGAAIGAVLAVVLGGLVAFRQQVAAVLPSVAPAYAAIGLPVDVLGLVIESVRIRPELQAGRPVLSVTGAIRNTRKQAVTSPRIRISLLDKSGHPVSDHLYSPLNAKVPPEAKRYFAVTLANPPAQVRQLEVGFASGVKGALPVPEAQPLPHAAAPPSHE